MQFLESKKKAGWFSTHYAAGVVIAAPTVEVLASEFRHAKESLLLWAQARGKTGTMVMFTIVSPPAEHRAMQEYVECVYGEEADLAPLLQRVDCSLHLIDEQGQPHSKVHFTPDHATSRIMPRANQPEMSQEFADLVFLALDHGVASVRDSGGPLIPFVMFEQDGKRELHRFATERLEEGRQRAREAIAAFPPDVTAYALAYDGFITIHGAKTDAILVEASERNRPAGVRMAQRYIPKKFLRKFQTVGNSAMVGECETLLR